MGFYHRKSINMGGAVEGHARGVGKYIATLFGQERDNPAYLHHYLGRSIPELATAYVWLCRKFDSTPDAKLAESARRFANETGELSAHTLGNSLFKIYQHAKGQEMLPDMVHGKFVFPD